MGTRSLQSTKVGITVSTTLRHVLDINSRVATSSLSYSKDVSIASGVDEGQADRAWEFAGTILSGGSVVIPLSTLDGFNIGAGAGLDALGQSMLLLELVTIVISNENAAGASGKLEIGPNDSNGFTGLGTHTVSLGGALGPQGVFVKHSPDSSGIEIDGVDDELKLSANGGDVSYRILLLARHDVDDSSSSSSTSSNSSSSSTSSNSSSSSSSNSSSSPSSNSSSSSLGTSSSSSST